MRLLNIERIPFVKKAALVLMLLFFFGLVVVTRSWSNPGCNPNQIPARCERNSSYSFYEIYCSISPVSLTAPSQLCVSDSNNDGYPDSPDVHDYIDVRFMAPNVSIATLWIKTIGTGTWIPIGTYPVEPTLYNYVIIRNVDSRTFPLITTSCWRDTNGYYQITATFNTTQGPTYMVKNDWTVRIPRETVIQRPDCER